DDPAELFQRRQEIVDSIEGVDRATEFQVFSGERTRLVELASMDGRGPGLDDLGRCRCHVGCLRLDLHPSYEAPRCTGMCETPDLLSRRPHPQFEAPPQQPLSKLPAFRCSMD